MSNEKINAKDELETLRAENKMLKDLLSGGESGIMEIISDRLKNTGSSVFIPDKRANSYLPPTDCLHITATEKTGRKKSVFVSFNRNDVWFNTTDEDAASILIGSMIGRMTIMDRSIDSVHTRWFTLRDGKFEENEIQFGHKKAE